MLEMTIAELLEPQPAPTKNENSKSITDWLASFVSDARIAVLVRARREQGTEWYGTELLSHNGRNSTVEVIQELVDASVYSAQRYLENPGRENYNKLAAILNLLGSELKEIKIVSG